MIMVYLNLIFVAVIVNLINIYFARHAGSDLAGIVRAGIAMIPMQALVSVGYAYYYAKGSQNLSYLALNLSAYPVMIGMGIAAHFIFFREHQFTWMEIAGICFTVVGLGFFVANNVVKGG